MLIVADENIPCVREAFSPHGEVRLISGRRMTPETVRDADALLVRSITPVNAELLARSRVRFVGSATAGIDHIDAAWLRRREIRFASAPGSNAESVAQWIAAALFELRRRRECELKGMSIGIVGVGQCGSRMLRIARALGMKPLLCDPPMERSGSDLPFRRLDELADCDVLTLHVPLTENGADATFHLIDEEFLRKTNPRATLINSSRGGVADEAALADALDRGRPGGAAIDTWRGEPHINLALLERTAIATPHIAGYTLDSKLRGTEMIYRAFCEWAGCEPCWSAASTLPSPAECLEAEQGGGSREAALARLVEASYRIMEDDARLRRIAELPARERGSYFDDLRKNYGPRREFGATRILIPHENQALAEAARGLGFEVETKK